MIEILSDEMRQPALTAYLKRPGPTDKRITQPTSDDNLVAIHSAYLPLDVDSQPSGGGSSKVASHCPAWSSIRPHEGASSSISAIWIRSAPGSTTTRSGISSDT